MVPLPIPNPLCLVGPNFTPRRPPPLSFHKHVLRNISGFSNLAVCTASDEFMIEERPEQTRSHVSKTDTEAIDFLHLMEQRGIRANSQTYLGLLDCCFNSGSLLDAKRLQARILKSGFAAQPSLCSLLVDIYVSRGDLDGATKVFDDMPVKHVCSWNNIISRLSAKNLTAPVLVFFSQMLAENVVPDEPTFAAVLRAFTNGNVSLHWVEQIHAKIFRLGVSTSTVVCNPLIELYSKNGFVESAKRVFEKLCLRDNVSWVAMISGFSQNGCEEEAILLFRELIKSGTMPTPYVFSSITSACTKIELLELGEQLHSLIFKWGFSSEIFVCNALVSLYMRWGSLTSAEKVFNNMLCRDIVSYNSIISGLAQHGISGMALQLFKNMQLDGLKPDCVTVTSLLSASGSVGALVLGLQLHSYAIKAGFSSDIIIEGSLLDLYVKCSDIDTANKFFLATETKNVVLWNVMLVAFGQMGDLVASVDIFSKMQIKGLRPNQYTYPSILRTCTSLGELELGEQIHSQVIKTGFQPNVYVSSVLIDMYAKHGRLDTSEEILRRLSEDDVVSWTAMIAGYAQHDLCVEALKTFKEMQNRGIQSDNVGFASAISACAGIQTLNQGRQIHAQSVVSGYTEDLSIGNALVSLYARCAKVNDAYLAFDKIDSKDNISWNGLISGFAQSSHCEEALNVFSQMNQAGVKVDLFTFASAVSAVANIANIKDGKQIHAMMIKTGNDMETESSNVLITLYSKCGSIDDAKKEFSEMPEKNEVSWNAMITGFSQHGHGNEAINLFEEMKHSGVMPTHVTFVSVLSACSHVGLVNEGLNYFNSMSKDHGLVPKPEHYVCVVDILGRAGHLDRAQKFIDEMPIKPDAMVWRTLLSACTIHKNIEIGEVAAQHLLELEPEDSATYVLLSNIYAVCGKWNQRDRVRQMMKDRGVKKEPGRSWVEVNNSVHAFFVGDKLHPLADKIYEFLAELNKRASEIGYVQDSYSLLNETDCGQKDPTALVHSERLAIAFALLSLSDKMPIRVMKNLRVCNDCHNWIKFVSKVTNRAIIVRDAYRFHHFGNGCCSCRDYW